MVINALNSGAKTFMADFEDANSPTWENTVGGQINLRDAVRRTIRYVSPEGKRYELKDRTAVLIVRPRGWHLPEKHVLVDGEPISGALFDFGLYFFTMSGSCWSGGRGRTFTFPKWKVASRPACGTMCSTWPKIAWGFPGHHQSHGVDRDDPRGLRDGRDPV